MAQGLNLREINDAIRKAGNFGPETDNPLVVTPGVNAFGPEIISALFLECMTFEDFTSDNDPGEMHDFGVLKSAGQDVWFKFDIHHEAAERRIVTFLLPHEN